MAKGQREIQIHSASSSPLIPSMVGAGDAARALVWPGMGAQTRSMHLIDLSKQGQTRELRHDSEAVYYVISGNVIATDRDTGTVHRVPEGGMILVEPATRYVLSSPHGPAEVVGGPCPPDRGLYDGMLEG